jgi:hypothetical protein
VIGVGGGKRIGWSLVRSSSSDDREKAHRKPNTIASLLLFVCFCGRGGISIALFAYGTSPDDLFHVSFQILGGGDHIKRDPYGENKKTGKLEAHEHNGQLVCPSVKYTLLLFLILI